MHKAAQNASSSKTQLLPEGFQILEPLVGDWALPTQTEREARRLASNPAELQSVYDALFPHISKIMEEVDKFPMGKLPEAHGRLFSLALALAEIAPNVELYKGDVRVTNDFDERRFNPRHGAHPTWTGLHPR